LALTIPGPTGPLDALIDLPDGTPRVAVVFAHPHPQQGGTMHTKAVFQGAKGLTRIGCAVLRFNFRGAGKSEGHHDNGLGEQDDLRAVIEFVQQRYPEAEIYKIEVNYRSTPEILALANAAIATNQEQFVKRLTPARKSGPKPVVVTCGDGSEQAAFVAQRILELREEGMNINRMAVLYRSHFHALELQLELTRRNIPFSITSGIRFFEQAHIKDVTAYLKLVANPNDELSFKRLVQLLPGIGSKGAGKLWQCFAVQLPVLGADSKPQVPPATTDPMIRGTELDEETHPESDSPDLPQLLATALAACSSIVSAKSAVAWAEFTATLSQLEADSLRRQPARMIRLVLEAGYEEYVKENFANYRSRLEDLEQLGNFALQFPDITEFLTQLSLLTNLEADDERPVSSDTEQIRLSTVHQAKGLEFDVVFILMLCDGLFPSARSLKSRFPCLGLKES
jgi:DNA helicase-2/ATP-dependent DNA helicase PcrA